MAFNNATSLLRACLYGGESSLVGGLPSIPSHPGRESFSYVPLYIAANCLHEKLQSWLQGQGDPGWRVTRFEGRVTLGSEPTFFHINSLVIFASPTRDKSTHTEYAQMLQTAKTTSKSAVNLSKMVFVDVSAFLILEKAAIIAILK